MTMCKGGGTELEQATLARPSRLKYLCVNTLKNWSDDNASIWAAALAFYTMMSLGPLLFIAVAISGIWLGDDTARDAVVRQASDTIGPQAADAVQALIIGAGEAHSGWWATVVGAATLAFGASGVFAALQDAINTIWHVVPKPSGGVWLTVKRRFVSMAMVVGIGFLLVVSFVASATLSALQDLFASKMIFSAEVAVACEASLSLFIFTLLFGAMYKVLPDARLRWSDVWSGGLVTASLFSIGKVALAFYLRRAHIESAYGAAGNLALLLIWVYYAAQIFFLGAEWVRVNVYSKGRQVEPSRDAIAVQTVNAESKQPLGASRLKIIDS